MFGAAPRRSGKTEKNARAVLRWSVPIPPEGRWKKAEGVSPDTMDREPGTDLPRQEDAAAKTAGRLLMLASPFSHSDLIGQPPFAPDESMMRGLPSAR